MAHPNQKNTALALETLLGAFARSYETRNETPPSVAKATEKMVKVKVAKTGKITAVVETAKVEKPVAFMPGVILPCKGTLNARQFIRAMNVAKDRDEKVIAISGFVGFDVAKPIGEQEVLAFAEAKRIMRPMTVDASEPRRRAAPSVAGFVAGMPDANRKQIENLLARERQAVRAMGDALLEGGEMGDARIAIEKARIDAIRADLANLRLKQVGSRG